MKTKTKLTPRQQEKLALTLLEWHGGGSSALYAVGSCMLSDANNAREYDPANHRGHADSETETGAVRRACFELRGLRKNANYPEAVTAEMEAECNALADKLTGLYLNDSPATKPARLHPESDTAHFLETLLFCMESPDRPELAGKTIYDFSPEFVAGVDSFISGFREYLDGKGFDLSRLDNLERPFGGNCYASLSGHGIGFFDDSDPVGDELHEWISWYSKSQCRFEHIDLSEDENGKLDLSFIPSALPEYRARLFTV